MVSKELEMSKTSVKTIFLIGVFTFYSLPSYGQLLMVYNDGVSDEQSMRDQGACATWATQSSGYNPAYGSRSARDGTQAARIRDTSRGAMFGAAIGGVAGYTGTGAYAGTTSIAMIGGNRHRAAMRQQQEYHSRNKASYSRALSACLRGRGYTVN